MAALTAVVEAGGYAQASRRLHRTQSTVTYTIQKLEDLLGLKVFEIRGRKTPHWTGLTNSPATFGHFGASGTLMWADLDRGIGLVCLANRGTYSGWMLAEGGWVELSAAVIDEHGAQG